MFILSSAVSSFFLVPSKAKHMQQNTHKSFTKKPERPSLCNTSIHFITEHMTLTSAQKPLESTVYMVKTAKVDNKLSLNLDVPHEAF